MDAKRLRDQILRDQPDVVPEEYDLLVALGYEPESWQGMWKLHVRPIIFRGFGIVITREHITNRITIPRFHREPRDSEATDG
jgi:hypothetical protein